jgi:hypothetical protein
MGPFIFNCLFFFKDFGWSAGFVRFINTFFNWSNLCFLCKFGRNRILQFAFYIRKLGLKIRFSCLNRWFVIPLNRKHLSIKFLFVHFFINCEPFQNSYHFFQLPQLIPQLFLIQTYCTNQFIHFWFSWYVLLLQSPH